VHSTPSILITKLRWWPIQLRPWYESSLLPRHCRPVASVEGRAMLRSANYGELVEPRTRVSAMVHAASVLPHHLSGTIYHDTSKTMTLVVNNSLAIWRHFCLLRPICHRRLWKCLFKRCFINELTDLLTVHGTNSAFWVTSPLPNNWHTKQHQCADATVSSHGTGTWSEHQQHSSSGQDQMVYGYD